MNVGVEERLHDYGPRLDGAITSYVDRSHDRVASLVEPAASEGHAGARRRATALAVGAIAIALVVATTILATRRTPAHPPARTAATTTTTIGLHTIDGRTFGPMPPSQGEVSLSQKYAEAPDFVAVASSDGSGVAGYVKKADLFPQADPNNPPHFPGGVLTVYADGGTTVVGHFYPGKGFVPLSENPAHVPNRRPPPTVITH